MLVIHIRDIRDLNGSCAEGHLPGIAAFTGAEIISCYPDDFSRNILTELVGRAGADSGLRINRKSIAHRVSSPVGIVDNHIAGARRAVRGDVNGGKNGC